MSSFYVFENVHESLLKESIVLKCLNPLSANPTKWLNTLKQFAGCCQRIVWMFDHFMGLALKGLNVLSTWAPAEFQDIKHV